MLNTIFILWFIFEIKHFLADFILQTDYMLGKFKRKGWIKPLITHCTVHMIFTAIILLSFGSPYAYLLALLDFSIHFVMDRIKASPDLLGRFRPLSPNEYTYHKSCSYITSKIALRNNKYFWWSLGLDQMVHNVTSLIIVYFAVTL